MAFNSTKNYYEILGISIESSTDEIKTAYRKLARKYHPDINKEPGAEEKFKGHNSSGCCDYDLLFLFVFRAEISFSGCPRPRASS